MRATNDHKNDATHIYSRLNPPYSRSKEEVWAAIESRIEVKGESQTGILRSMVFRYAVAASLLVLIGLGAAMQFYSVTVSTLRGQHSEVVLPDGSQVTLNALSQISYKPLAWIVQRRVKLSGEAFFEVKKGKTFSVVSNNVTTSVLGTSFNVYARNNRVNVICVTGSVKVASGLSEVLLKPGDEVDWTNGVQPVIKKASDVNEAKSWMNSMFHYRGVSLTKVLEDISLQLDVEVHVDSTVVTDSLSYTGFLNSNNSADDMLMLVCKPFGINVKNAGERVYQLTYAP